MIDCLTSDFGRVIINLRVRRAKVRGKEKIQMVKQLASPIKFQTRCGKAIEQFLSEHEKKSKKTKYSYKGDIKKFLKEVYGESTATITEEDLNLLDFDSFSDYINSIKGSNSTVNRHTSTIRSLMGHLKDRNFITADIGYLNTIKLKRNNSKRIDIMTREIVLNYINIAEKEKNHAEKKQKLIMFAVDTALRLEDYLEMEWNQFSPQEEWVIVKGYGKGGKLWIEKISYDVYNSLLEMRLADETKVFAPLNEKNIWDMMNRIKLVLGYNDRAYSFHSFKKTSVTFTYRLTGDILEAMKKGKHSNIETTRIYLEEEDYGMTGMFSLGEHDPDLYKKIPYEELLAALKEMNKDTLHLLNIKIDNLQKRHN